MGQNLFIRVGPRFKLSLTLTFAKIGGNLDFSGNTLASVDLSATHVRGDLVLGPPAPHWSEGARLALRNTEVGVLGDPNHAWSDNTWPEENNLDLDGFVYTSIVIFPGTDPNTTKKISVPRFIGWLEKQKRYYPQPYEQVANVFQKEGLKDEAADMLYEGKTGSYVRQQAGTGCFCFVTNILLVTPIVRITLSFGLLASPYLG